MELSAVLTPAQEGGYVAFNPETGTTTQGETVEEALANLAEATELYLEEFPMTITSRALLTTFQIPGNALIAGCLENGSKESISNKLFIRINHTHHVYNFRQSYTFSCSF